MASRYFCAYILIVVAATSAAIAQDPQTPKPKNDRPREGSLQKGDEAPNFKLKRLNADEEIELSSFRGKRPVVLVFGSYT